MAAKNIEVELTEDVLIEGIPFTAGESVVVPAWFADLLTERGKGKRVKSKSSRSKSQSAPRGDLAADPDQDQAVEK